MTPITLLPINLLSLRLSPSKIVAMALMAIAALAMTLSHTDAHAQNTSAISKGMASKFISRNRDDMLEYQCLSATPKTCSVICSSGGNDYINIENVSKAFYSERRSSLNGTVTGYYLVVDVVNSADNQDIWATLQIESSCLFKGMTPKL